MDPLILLPTIVPIGAIAGKVIHKKVQDDREEDARHREISFFSAEGKLETKIVRAERIEGDDAFDANDVRIGYSPHYTRMLEIKILGHALTSCNCETCQWEAEEEERRERERAEELRRIEYEKYQAKRRAEQAKRDAAERARLEKEQRERLA